METPQIEVLRVEIAKLELKPDDKLLVTLPKGTPREHAMFVHQSLERILGAADRYIVKTADVEVSIVSPSDREDETRA